MYVGYVLFIFTLYSRWEKLSRIIFEMGVLYINIDVSSKSGQAISVFAFNISLVIFCHRGNYTPVWEGCQQLFTPIWFMGFS